MNTMLSPRTRSKTTSLLLYGLAITLVVLAPAMGAVAAAVAFWQALLAGSVWYMPIGLVLVLAAIAVMQSHKPFDLAVLGLVIVAPLAWFSASPRQQEQLLNAVLALPSRTLLLGGVLPVMILALVLIHAARRSGRW